MQTFHPTTQDHTPGEDFDAAFQALLATWNTHQNLKAAAAPTEALWESNNTLSQHRFSVARSRCSR